MFCPKCATPNADGAKYCRKCGANISMLPAALGGGFPTQSNDNMMGYGIEDYVRRGRRRGVPNEGDGIKKFFVGIGFLVLAIALAISGNGHGFWFWFLIPAFSCMGTGVSIMVRSSLFTRAQGRPQMGSGVPSIDNAPQLSTPQQTFVSTGPRNTGELVPQPPSVTEGTTRHLGIEEPTRHFSSSGAGEEENH